MDYFDDIVFLAGDIAPRCQSVLRDAHFPHCALQLILATGRRPVHYAVDAAPRHTLTSPHWTWHHPDHRYSYAPARPGGDWLHCWVAFTGARGVRLLEQGFMALAPAGILPARQPDTGRAVFRRLVDLLARDQGHAAAVVELERLLVLAQADARPSASDGLSALVERIDTVPGAVIDFHAEAATLGWTYHHFRRRFREHTGSAPLAYLVHRRLQQAASDLRSSDDPITTIAARAGYDDPAHFARLFRTHMGLGPTAFRHGNER